MTKKATVSAFIIILFSLLLSRFTKAQTIELLAGNALNGAMTGTVLGGATMALNNSNDFGPIRVGVGAGTLYGIGVGVYDVYQVSKGEQFYISGTFNDGDNTTVIVLLDTFYGAAAGAVIATSFNLIANEPIDEALQYGSGIGAWAGFGFGLMDAFFLAERPGDFTALQQTNSKGGFVSISNDKKDYRINLLNPAIYSVTEFGSRSITFRTIPAIDVFNFKIGL